MERLAYKSLLAWKNSDDRKPLVLYGARQVGKTYILKEFGKREFKNTLYLNFDKEKKLHGYFADSISPKHIINSLKTEFGQEINAETLLIFDEIQECQRAKDALKYFNEDAPEYHLVAAGSFLGIAGGKFPVGQVNRLTLYPMSFFEFLEATGNEMLLQNLRSPDKSLVCAMHPLAAEKLRQYFYIGGMPEAVKTYAKTGDLLLTRQVQENILSNYKEDFLKHIKGSDIPKVRMLWDSIPVHLAKEKKKFMYKEIKQGGRAAEFENALDWLVNTGLVYKVSQTTSPSLPLSRNAKEAFKLYMLDIGLLGAKANLDIKTFFEHDNKIFGEFKGALTEQFALQELKANSNYPIFYWANDSGSAEVDFLLQYKNEAVPLEVKSGIQTKAKSLNVYIEKYNPNLAIKSSLKHYGKSGNLFSVPLYLLGDLGEYLV